MTRKHTSADFHVFTTHFYTTLEDNGVEGVSNWTTKKKIDVFNLRFVFIPSKCALVEINLVACRLTLLPDL